MNNIFKIKDVNNELANIEFLEDGIHFIFKKNVFLDFEGKCFDENNRNKIMTLFKDSAFSKFTKEILVIDKDDILCIKKKDDSYVILSILERAIVTKNGIKIIKNNSKDFNSYLDIPFIFRIDNRTKNMKFIPIISKEMEDLFLISKKLLNNEEKVFLDYSDYFIDDTRQATSSVKGYIEQSLMALYFLFYNNSYKKIKSIKIEGKLEDIEIEYRDGCYDYIQVKIAEYPQDESSFNKTRFIEGVDGLKLTNEKAKRYGININKLIYASNTFYQPINYDNKYDNFFISIRNDTEILERKKIQEEYELSDEFIDKFFLSRVNKKFLELESNNFYSEYSSLNNDLTTNEIATLIYDDLKKIFISNSMIREKKIDIYEIAYVFLRKNKSSRKFNEYYNEDIQNVDEADIDDLIFNANLKQIIEYESRQLYLVELYLELKKEWEEKNNTLSFGNLKGFIEENYEKLEEENIILMNLDLDKKKLVYKFLLYTIYMKKGDLSNLKRCFELEE